MRIIKNQSKLLETLLVFIGGGIGSVFRFYTGKMVGIFLPEFPLATLLSNATGSFLLGLVFGFYSNEGFNKNAYLFFATGICGGYSTYSSFTLETLKLFVHENYSFAFLNILFNFIICSALIGAGFYISKSFK